MLLLDTTLDKEIYLGMFRKVCKSFKELLGGLDSFISSNNLYLILFSTNQTQTGGFVFNLNLLTLIDQISVHFKI